MKRNSPGVVILSVASLTLLLPVFGFAQSPERMVDKMSWRNEPIKVLKLKNKNRSIALGKKFAEGDDWLNGLTVTVRNVSDKAIAHIDLRLDFPRPGGGSSPETAIYMVHMIYGREPVDVSAEEVLKVVSPGETVDITLLEVNMPFIKEDLEKLGYEHPIKHAQIMVDSVTFVDGSEWAGDGILLYPNPNNPKQKINPMLPLNIQVPKRSNSPSSHGKPAYQPFDFPFLNVGLKRAHATSRVNSVRSLWLPQLPDETQPCNQIYLGVDEIACGPVGEGCKYKKPAWVANPTVEQGMQLNARKIVGQVRCQYNNGALCSPTFHLVEAKGACGILVAGTCGGLADWITFPSTGCITGLFFQGPCNRSVAFQSRCAEPTGYEPESCTCPDGASMSPIVIDVDHGGFSMTDAAGGVVFDMLKDGVPLAISWTAAGSTNSLLVLDRNGNGTIDNGEELFGDITPQPASSSPNGFLALAEYDKSASGGNGNGRIDRQDAIFSQLKLWRDSNHNGFSESSELQSLTGLLRAIDLDYKESRRTDQHGNQFRYRAKVYDVHGTHAGRWAWDVFLTVQ